ncbi:hypothetical protein JCM8202_004665 [Rhodotorula sphaerocarpa]
MGALVSTAAQTAANTLPSLATLRAAAGVTFDGPVARRASPAGSASPSYDDVLDVLDSLQQLRLPPELAIAVLDQAEYFPAVTAQWTGNLVASAGPRGDLVRSTILVTPPLPLVESAPEHYVQTVAVWTDSRDQGFSSFRELHGTRQGSSSWFELVLLRPTRSSVPAELADAIPPAPSVADPSSHERPEALLAGYEAVAVVRLHCNVHAAHTFAECITSLPHPERIIAAEDQGEDDGTVILRQMRPGDRLAVRACAQYPMWVNAVRGCAVKVQLKVI